MAEFMRIAHRGASGVFPENTRLAVEKAIQAGADMIELDCQLTSDGHVVIFHDEYLDRIAGVAGTVKKLTLAQLKNLDLGGWRNSAFKGERILTVEEVVEIVGGRADLCLEIKQFVGSPPGIELKLLFILSHYGYLDRTILSSFDYSCLRRVRELAPEAGVGLIFGAGSEDDPFLTAQQLGAASLHVQKELATPQFIARTRDLELMAVVWTVNEVEEMEQFISLGVDGIMTDFPERFASTRVGKR